MTSSDRFPVPVRSAVKSNLNDWCFQNLSKRALNALTVQASTTDVHGTFGRRWAWQVWRRDAAIFPVASWAPTCHPGFRDDMTASVDTPSPVGYRRNVKVKQHANMSRLTAVYSAIFRIHRQA